MRAPVFALTLALLTFTAVIEYRDGDDDWSCVLTLRFSRDALDINEPRPTCGGANVSFAGHYVRE